MRPRHRPRSPAPSGGRPLLLAAALAVGLLAAACAATPADPDPTPSPTSPWRPVVPADGLVTNEVADDEPDAPTSEDWVVTSGSLFARDGAWWSGVPDGATPDALSRRATGSSVLRAVSRSDGWADVAVELELDVTALSTTPRTPEQDYDGVHVFLRYASPDELYVVDLCRRDGTLTIKRKSPTASGDRSGGDRSAGDTDEEGSYTTLASTPAGGTCPTHPGAFSASVTTTDAGVRLEVVTPTATLSALDPTSSAITSPGRVGLRGDNAELVVTDLVVTDLAAGS